MKFDCDMTAFRDKQARIERDEAMLIDAAFRDLIDGRFDSMNVLEAMRLGHHPRYQALRQAAVDAIYVARQCGALR